MWAIEARRKLFKGGRKYRDVLQAYNDHFNERDVAFFYSERRSHLIASLTAAGTPLFSQFTTLMY